jgi:hypothetical protein
LAATWLPLAYHDADHASDFGGLVWDRHGQPGPKACYLDVKGTKARSPGHQRTKLEQRAQERKLGCLAVTVTQVFEGGFGGYPGRGKPGLLVTVLHNPLTAGKQHVGFAVGWFFGISSNYQASAAVWGWGGAQGVRLPERLMQLLRRHTTVIRGETKTGLELLGSYRDYNQYRGESGEWDRETLRATLDAKHLAAREILMQEDAVEHAQTTLDELQPRGVDEPLRLEDWVPGESFATYYGRKADAARRAQNTAEEHARQAEEHARQAEHDKRQAEEHARQAEEHARQAEEHARQAEEHARQAEHDKRQAEEHARQAEHDKRQAEERERHAEERERQTRDDNSKLAVVAKLWVAQQRLQGRSDTESASELGYSLEEFLARFPTM